MISTALILAGGKGERMMPLTELQPKALVPINGVPILGSSSEIVEMDFSVDTFFHIAIGDNVARGTIYDELAKANLKMLTIIHPLAFVSKNTKISDGCYILFS